MNSGSPFFAQRQSDWPAAARGLAIVVGICGLLACQHPTPPEVPPSGTPLPVTTAAAAAATGQSRITSSTSNAAESAVSLPPLPNQPPEATWTELPLGDFEPALLFYRKGAPLFVITHGAGGHAAWHCQHFHRLLDGRATLLCPQGKMRHAKAPAAGYYYPDHWALRREVLAAVERFEALVPAPGRSRPYVYAGYSQGATMGALAFAEHGALFPQLLLVEGGYADWSQTLIHRFRESGGKAALFICGTKHCATEASSAVRRFVAHGLRAQSAWAKGAGHIPDGRVGQLLSLNLGFLFEGEPHWLGFTPNPEAYSAPRGM